MVATRAAPCRARRNASMGGLDRLKIRSITPPTANGATQMAIRPIDLGAGTFPKNPASSDTVYSAFQKTNDNFANLEGRIALLEAADKDKRASSYSGATPHLSRGTVSGRSWSGVTPGAGIPRASRRMNLVGLQAAVNYASAHNKFFELEPGVFEIEGEAGLLIPASKDGFQWRGSKGSMIKQFSNNCPILTVGDVTATRRETQDLHLSGVRVFYASDQSGNVDSSALKIGLLRNSTIEQVSALADYGETGPLVKAYRGIHITSPGSRFGFFSNSLRDIIVGGAQHSLLDIALVGTGSVFSNVYLTQGVTGHPASILDAPLRIRGDADLYETVFEQLNIEWCIANTLIWVQSCRGTSFLGTHLEGNQLAGRSPSVVLVSTSQIDLSGFNVLDLGVKTKATTGGAPPPALFRCYGDNAIRGSSLQVSWSSPGGVDLGFDLVAVSETGPADAQQTVNVTNLIVRDVGGGNAKFLSLDSNMPASHFPTPSAIDTYTYGELFSQARGAKISAKANVTLFGQYSDPLLRYPAALGAPCTVTLSNRMKPGRVGAIPPPVGALAGVRRDSGVPDRFDLVVANHDGAKLSTISTAAVTGWFRFDGTNWASVV